MNTIVVNKLKTLLNKLGGGEAYYIYGAKTVAQRAYRYLTANNRTGMSGYLVSAKYDNPDQIDGIDVLRIENCKDRTLENVIIAVSGQAIWSIADDLKQYNIGNLFILSPFVIDDFPLKDIISDSCIISDEAIVSPNVQIFADETSKIIIRDHVLINDYVKILAMNHSVIEVDEKAMLDEGSFVNADHGKISIHKRIKIGRESRLSSESSKLCVGQDTCIDYNTHIRAGMNSSIYIGNNVSISDRCIVGASEGGEIIIGEDTTINSCMYMEASMSSIKFGRDCMFSYFVKMNSGSHTLYDNVTGENITHRDGITLGDHVWVGMGATFVDGCTVGDGSVIGASSVVTKDIPSHVTCAGNPARVLRENVRWDRNTM